MKWVKHIIAWLLIIGAVLDIFTTWLATNAHPSIIGLESNPVVNFLGLPLWLLYAIKLIFIILIIKIFYSDYQSERHFYVILLFVLFLMAGQFFAAYNNYMIYQNTDLAVQHFENVGIPPQMENARFYGIFMTLFVVAPFLIAFIPYLLFEWIAPYERFKKRRLIKE